MLSVPLHTWDLTPTEAVALQSELVKKVDVKSKLRHCELIAGADCSYSRFSPKFYAAVVVLRTSDCTIIESQGAIGTSPFPYVPGLLSFREAPIVLQAFAKLKNRPDAVMLDGQGLACHLGLWLGIPCFGCAKTRLVGEHEEPGPDAGTQSPLLDKGEVIGTVLRTKKRTRPLFVSAGHLIDLGSAVKWTLGSCRGYRVPEPTRQAHLYVNQMRLRDQAS
jgi:deoxyribonuclease V